MNLHEAIEHFRFMANVYDDIGGSEASAEKSQIAEWLEELSRWKRLTEHIDIRPNDPSVLEWRNIHDLERENRELRTVLGALAYCISESSDCDKCAMNGKPDVSVIFKEYELCYGIVEFLKRLGIAEVAVDK